MSHGLKRPCAWLLREQGGVILHVGIGEKAPALVTRRDNPEVLSPRPAAELCDKEGEAAWLVPQGEGLRSGCHSALRELCVCQHFHSECSFHVVYSSVIQICAGLKLGQRPLLQKRL